MPRCRNLCQALRETYVTSRASLILASTEPLPAPDRITFILYV